VIEIIDTEQKINQFLPALEDMIGSGVVTLQKVAVVRYGRKAGPRLSERSQP
jgi:PII-like signaling protein